MTTIKEIVDETELTTDACPHPPRDEKVVVEETPESIEKSPPLNKEPTSAARTPRRSRDKPKTNTSPIANIINIANCSNVQIGKKITYKLTSNIPEKEKSDVKINKENNYVKTETINKYLGCNEPLTTKHIDYISAHAKESWRDMARSLSYSDGQIYQFHENHYVRGVKEVIYQLLLDWIQNEAKEATIGRLMNALWDTKQEEVVLLFSKKFVL